MLRVRVRVRVSVMVKIKVRVTDQLLVHICGPQVRSPHLTRGLKLANFFISLFCSQQCGQQMEKNIGKSLVAFRENFT